MKPPFLLKGFLSLTLLLSQVVYSSPETPLPIENFAVPESLGKIETRRPLQSNRWVIHIQDVHAHFAAQENISAIVDQLNAVYGIKTVAIEGGWGETTFPQSWGLPNSREKQMLARALLEEDYITGPAYAALFSPMPIQLIGIEDEALYEENRAFFLRHLERRKEIEGLLQSYQDKISAEKQSSYSPGLLSFDTSLSEFREGKKAEKFIPKLLELAQSKGVELTLFDQIQLFKEALSLEKSLDKEKLNAEAKRLLEPYKRKRLSFEELLRSGLLDEEKISFYPETEKYVKITKLRDKILYREFFDEIESLIDAVKAKMIENEEQKALSEKSERFFLAKKFLLFQATPDDLRKIEAAKDLFLSELSAEGLGFAFDFAVDFYEAAKHRDEIFFDKITTDPRLSGNIAVVTGGFHTEGLSERFENSGISYMVVTPHLGEDTMNEELYFKRLQEPIEAEALANVRNRPFGRFDSRFPQGISALISKQDIRIAVKIVFPKTVFRQTSKVVSNDQAFDPKVFEALSPEKQLEQARSWADRVQIPYLLMFDVKDLRTLLETQDAKTFFNENLAVNNKGLLSYEDPTLIPTEALSAHNIKRVIAANLNELMKRDDVLRPYKDFLETNRIAAIAKSEDLLPESILKLPVDPLSFKLFALILANPDLYEAAKNDVDSLFIFFRNLLDQPQFKTIFERSA